MEFLEKFLVGALAVTLVFLMSSFLLKLGYNSSIAEMFLLPQMNFTQAMGATLFVSCLSFGLTGKNLDFEKDE